MRNNNSFSDDSQDLEGLLLRAFLQLTGVIILFSAGCATVGHDFPSAQVPAIQINQTKQDEIRSMFGPPWRVGIEDGQQTWTYGWYHYRLIGETSTKDLVVRFNQQGIVISYSYNTTEHNE